MSRFVLFISFLYVLSFVLTGCPFKEESLSDADTDTDTNTNTDDDIDTSDKDTWDLDSDTVDTDPMNLQVELVGSFPGTYINGVDCWGDKVAWQHRVEGVQQVALWDADTKSIEYVDALGWINTSFITMSSDVAAWSTNLDYEQPDIQYVSVNGGAPTLYEQTDRAEEKQRIHGDRIMYTHLGETENEVWLGTVGAGNDRLLSDVSIIASYDMGYDLWEDKLAYTDKATGDIIVEDLVGGAVANLGTGDGERGNIVGLRVSGDHVVYYRITGFGDNSIPVVGDIVTGEHRNMAYNIPGTPTGLDIDGNYAAWVGSDMDTGYTTTSVHVYDIADGVMRQGTEHIEGMVWDFGMGGGRMCWVTGPEPNTSDTDPPPSNVYTAVLP